MKIETLLKIHLFATIYMTGIIWLIQVIHYPLFKNVGLEQWPSYHQQHVKLTSIVIAGPMIIELFSFLGLIYLSHVYRSNTLFLISGLILIVIWAVTFLISVPIHNKLASGFDINLIDQLVSTNWIRTIAWTLRSALLLIVTSINFNFLKQ